MKTPVKLAAAIIIGVSALAFTASEASAAIACNRWGECWRVSRTWSFPASAGIVIHPDSWRWGPGGRRMRWRSARGGRGFWRNGIWVRF